MKICQVLAVFPYREQLAGRVSGGRYRVGGIGQYVYSLTTELARMGHQITIISPKARQRNSFSEIGMESVKIRRISPILNVYSSSLPLGILKSLNPKEYDIVHAHTPVPAIAELAALRNINSKTPFILSYHNDAVKAGGIGWLLSNIYKFTLGPFLLGRADVIIAHTRSLALNSARLANYLDKVKIIPSGVSAERFHPGLDRNRIRNKYGLGKEARIILFVGVLDAYKGCDYLVWAMSKIIHEVPEAKLMLVGTGPMEEALKTLVGKVGIDDSVIFAGFVPNEDLPYYYAACDVFVLPSVSAEEGFGLVQLEAMACGKPVVTTTIPGVSEVDAEEAATIHVPPRNIEALADAIIKIFKNGDLATRLGNGGRKLVESKYTIAKIAHDTQEIYSAVLGKKSERGAG